MVLLANDVLRRTVVLGTLLSFLGLLFAPTRAAATPPPEMASTPIMVLAVPAATMTAEVPPVLACALATSRCGWEYLGLAAASAGYSLSMASMLGCLYGGGGCALSIASQAVADVGLSIAAGALVACLVRQT